MALFERIPQLAITIYHRVGNISKYSFDHESGDWFSCFDTIVYRYVSVKSSCGASVEVQVNRRFEVVKVSFENCTTQKDLKMICDKLERIAIEMIENDK